MFAHFICQLFSGIIFLGGKRVIKCGDRFGEAGNIWVCCGNGCNHISIGKRCIGLAGIQCIKFVRKGIVGQAFGIGEILYS